MASGTRCQMLSPCPAAPMSASSQTDPLLAKPISDGGNTPVTTDLKMKKKTAEQEEVDEMNGEYERNSLADTWREESMLEQVCRQVTLGRTHTEVACS